MRNTNPRYRSGLYSPYGYSRTPWYKKGSAWLAIVVGIACLFLVGSCASSYYSDESVVIKVTGKEAVPVEGGHEYRVYTEDETYVMKDSLVKGRFRTSNEYSKIKDGGTYTCTKFGVRVPLFSMFENIRDCREGGKLPDAEPTPY
jgi:hypothetical protein